MHHDLAGREAPRELSQRASFWISAGVVAHTLWTSAAPTMTYRLYARDWNLSNQVTTAIFAIYPIVVVTVLVLFGNLSQALGRRVTMLLGLMASLAGVVVFGAASNVTWLLLGRAFMGIGVGLSAGPSTAALPDFSPAHRVRFASSVATAAQAFGMTASLLVGGALAQYAPYPTRLCFVLLAGLLSALLVGAWSLPRDVGAHAGKAWRPVLPSIPRGSLGVFAVSLGSLASAYTHGAIFLSLGGQVAHDLVGSSNALVNGAVLALFPVFLGLAGILARQIDIRRAMTTGAATSVLGMALLAGAVATRSLTLLLFATAVAGAGYGLQVAGGLAVIGHRISSATRASFLSVILLVAYFSMGGVALVLGAVATEWSLRIAVYLGAASITAMSMATLAVVHRYFSKPSDSEGKSA